MKMPDRIKEYAASLRRFLSRKLGSFGEWSKDYFGSLWRILALPQLAKTGLARLKTWNPRQTPRWKFAIAALLLLLIPIGKKWLCRRTIVVAVKANPANAENTDTPAPKDNA